MYSPGRRSSRWVAAVSYRCMRAPTRLRPLVPSCAVGRMGKHTVAQLYAWAVGTLPTVSKHPEIDALERRERDSLDDGRRDDREQQQNESHKQKEGERSRWS
jgi:hypothetical protein